MAGSFRFAFAVDGDASKAIAAMEKLAKSMDRLAKVLEAFGKSSDAAGKRSTRAARDTEKAWKKTAQTVQSIVPIMNKVGSGVPQTVPGGGAGGGGVPPGGVIDMTGIFGGGGGGGSFPALPDPDIIDGVFRVLRDPPNFRGIASNLGLVATTMGTVGRAALGAGRNMMDSFGNKLVGMFENVGRSVEKFRGYFANIVDSFRLTGQAITNVGRSLFFFVSIPLTGFLAGMTKAAVDFDDALIRVRKTSGLTREQMKGLSQDLRAMARVMAVGHVELATMAEVIGQSGVKSAKAIAELTEVFAMLSVTTDMTADQASNQMVRIANAFGWNLNKSTEEVMRLSNVVNKLENDTAASSAQIVQSMSKWAQVAGQLKITAAEAAGLSASLIAMGISDDEAGTALRNMGIYLIRNVGHLTQVMGATEKYKDTQSALNAINEDVVQVYMDLAQATKMATDEGKNAEALMANMAVGNLRGGRGLAALATGYDLVVDNLNKANREWESATSLLTEYNMAMESTKSQMQVLKNNINDVGISVGNTLLPYINALIQVAIPALQELGKAFEKLASKQKLAIVGGVLLAIVIGPLLMFFGQLFHALMLALMGFSQLLRVFPLVVTALTGITKVVFGFGKSLFTVPGLILAATFAVLKILSKMGVDVAGFFIELGSAAVAWGENLSQQLSIGLLSGAVRFISQAINWIANLIASFFQGHSPPKDGPLSTIDKWGSAVMQAYLDGFLKADFSVLETAGRYIERVLTRSVEQEALPDALAKVAEARMEISKVIKKFNDTGIIDVDMLNAAVAGMGHMADELARLVELSLEYNQLQQQLADIEKQRKNVNKTYKEEINSIADANMTIEEKVAAMRNANRVRDASLYALEEEEESLKDQSDELKEQRDYQQALIDSMMTQDDLLGRILDTMKQISGAAAGMGDFELPGLGDTGEFDDFTESVEEMAEQVKSFVERLDTGRKALQGFFDGFNGKDKMNLSELAGTPIMANFEGKPVAEGVNLRDFGPDPGDFKAYELYDFLYDIGVRADELKGKFEEWGGTFEEISKSLSGIYDILSGVKSLGEGLGGILTGDKSVPGRSVIPGESPNDAWAKNPASFVGSPDMGPDMPILAKLADDIGKLFNKFVEANPSIQIFLDSISAIGSIISDVLGPGFDSIVTGIQDFITSTSDAVNGLRELTGGTQGFAGALGYFFSTLSGVFLTVLNVIALVISAVLTILGTIIGVVGHILGFVYTLVSGLISVIWNLLQGIFNIFMMIIMGIYGIFTGNFEGLRKYALSFVVNLGNIFRTMGEIARAAFLTLINVARTILTGMFNLFKSILNSILTHFKIWGNRLKLSFGNIKLFEVGKNVINGLLDGLKGAWGRVEQWLSDAASAVANVFQNILGIESPSKVFEGFGKNTILGFQLGFAGGMPGAMGVVGDFGSSLASNTAANIGGYSNPPEGINNSNGLTIQINNPVVREDQDIDRIAEAVQRKLSRTARNGAVLGRSR